MLSTSLNQSKSKILPQPIALREPFFIGASLDNDLGFCIDDRQSKGDVYLSAVGGVMCFINIYSIMREIYNPGSRQADLAADAALITKSLNLNGLRFGIHSDTDNEHGNSFKINSKNTNLGCGFINNLANIQYFIYDHQDDLIKLANQLRPELFVNLDGQLKDFIDQFFKASLSLAKSDYYSSTTPRQVAKIAVTNGARTMVVEGQHDKRSIGIINLVSDSTLDINLANKHGLPAYDHDSWVVIKAVTKINELYPYNLNEMAIVDLISVIGTMRFLSVSEIFVR